MFALLTLRRPAVMTLATKKFRDGGTGLSRDCNV